MPRNVFDRYLQLFQRSLANVEALPQLAILGLLSGLATGLVVLLFRLAIEGPLVFLLPGADAENFEALDPMVRGLLPLAGALLVGALLHQLSAPQRRLGITHVMERLGYHQGHLSLKSAINQFVLGVLTVISGLSSGREGPAVHLGAASSSLLGQWMRLPNNSIRTLVACGTAAAISASFNTPIAGVIFAMEVVLMEYTISGFTPVILAAVSAAVVHRLVYGDMPAFVVPPLAMNSLLELPYIVLMGLVFAACSALFVATLKYFTRYSARPILLRVLAAGAVTGLTAIALPEIMGIGYDTVTATIAGSLGLGLGLLLAVGVAKLLLTATTAGLGVPVGVIGPTLVVGATLGAAMGIAGQAMAPATASSTGFYALLGMGAMMGATLQAPLSALMALMELTRSTQIILPAMLIITVASLTAAAVFKQRSVFITALQAAGLDYGSTPLSQALRRVGVGAIMDRNFARTPPALSLDDAKQILLAAPKWILVENEKGPMFVLPGSDLARYLEQSEQPEQAEPGAEPGATRATLPDGRIDLCEIPAQRRDLAPLQHQATLEEALEKLDALQVEALYVERIAAPLIKPIIGVITRGDIEGYYLLKKK